MSNVYSLYRKAGEFGEKPRPALCSPPKPAKGGVNAGVNGSRVAVDRNADRHRPGYAAMKQREYRAAKKAK